MEGIVVGQPEGEELGIDVGSHEGHEEGVPIGNSDGCEELGVPLGDALGVPVG
jgi:hypothetical protein